MSGVDESGCTLVDGWRLRNAAAETLLTAETHMQGLVAAASVEQLVELVEAFSPTRMLGPDWARSFEPLVERLWAWADPAKIAALEANFRARGPDWAAVANNFIPERGSELHQRLRRASGARMPAFTIG